TAAAADADDGDVVEGTVTDDPRLGAVAVRELDVHGVRLPDLALLLARVRDYVGARQHEPVCGDEEARALSGGGLPAAVAEDGVDRDDTVRALPVDARRLEPVHERLRDRHRPRRLRQRRHPDDDRPRNEPAE